MIPKIIHYCWLSNEPMPADIQGYISTWKQHLGGYEFMKWDFNKFPKNKSIWVSEAYDCKKYAFAADYIRLYALYNYGGIYLDSDVEVLKSFDKFLELNTMLCYENIGDPNKPKLLEVAAFGVAKGERWIGDCLRYYEGRHFIKNDGQYDIEVLPKIVGKILHNNGYIIKEVYSIEDAHKAAPKEIPVFPFEYFSPKNLQTMEITISNNTHSIHNYKGSWSPQPFLHFLIGIGLKYQTAVTIIHMSSLPQRVIKSIQNGVFIEKLKKHILHRNQIYY